VSGHAIA
jgi:hypothetical protein